jgi:hypothetical protein
LKRLDVKECGGRHPAAQFDAWHELHRFGTNLIPYNERPSNLHA